MANDNDVARRRRAEVLGPARADLLAHLHVYVASLERRVDDGVVGNDIVLRVAESCISSRLASLAAALEAARRPALKERP